MRRGQGRAALHRGTGRGCADEARITLAEGTRDVGIAGMLADLIRQNLEQNPLKRADFDRLRAVVYIEVRDADVAATLVFDGGSLTVHGGRFGEPALRISADAQSVLALCAMKIVRGLPDPLHRDSRALLGRILTREIRIEGMSRAPMQLLRFTRLMSVRS